MAVKRKAGTKKKAAKKSTAKKSTATRVKAIREPYTRSEMLSHIANSTGLTKKQVSEVFEEFKNVIEGHIKTGSARVFTMPGLFKIKVNI